jgi:DNA-binding NtrC family response regulator
MISNVKIAVVDDDQLIRDFLVDVLVFCVNRDVLSFDSGSTAWDYLQAHEDVDIIFCDVDLPGMNGLQLLSKTKKKFPNRKCIVMSGDPATEKSAEKLGADTFLAKPFNLKDLFDIVQVFVVEGTRKPIKGRTKPQPSKR